MKLYLKIGLALAIVFVFLMTSALLTSEAASDGANQQPRITAEATGVMANARITTSGGTTDRAELDVGGAEVNFPPGGSASAQFNNSELPLRGTPIVTSGPGSGAVSITQTGPEAFRVQSNYAVDEVYYSDSAVTFDRVEARLICDVAGGNVTCPVQDVVFKNLMVNGEKMPNRPGPNTKREFTRQVTVGGVSFPAKYVVTLSPSSVMTEGGKTSVRLAGIDAVARSVMSADASGSQEAMLFAPFRNGVKNGGPNIVWAPSHLKSPGAKIRQEQLRYEDLVVCVPMDFVMKLIELE